MKMACRHMQVVAEYSSERIHSGSFEIHRNVTFAMLRKVMQGYAFQFRISQVRRIKLNTWQLN